MARTTPAINSSLNLLEFQIKEMRKDVRRYEERVARLREKLNNKINEFNTLVAEAGK